MKNALLSVLFAFLCIPTFAATVFSQDGIRLNYFLKKEQVTYVPALKKNVIIWRSSIELINSNNRPVAVTGPCCLYYAFAYLFPAEIDAVQNYLPDHQISDLYKAYATPKSTMLQAKQKVSNVQYFATYEDVNLHDATYNLEVKYTF